VQYGPPGQVVTPTVPLQVELRADGTAYRWLCAGAPDDGSVNAACARPTRTNCLVGSVAWNGARWRVTFPDIGVTGIPNLGDITPDGKGDVLIAYINPTYSGGLFGKTATSAADLTGCTQ
jgi:hypothetical protein